MSLSTTKRQFAGILHEPHGYRLLPAHGAGRLAHNMPCRGYPWKFSSVISVASHEESDLFTFFSNPDPPVEFFARGVDVEVAWVGGSKIRCTGNSFATPHMSGVCASLSKHPELTPFQLRERPPDVHERGRWRVSDELRAAVAAGVAGSEAGTGRSCSRRSRSRAIFGQGVVGLPARRGDDELVFEAVAGEARTRSSASASVEPGVAAGCSSPGSRS